MLSIQSKEKLTSSAAQKGWAGIRLAGLLACSIVLFGCGHGDKAVDQGDDGTVTLSEKFDRNNLGAELSSMLRSHADSKIHWQAFSPEVLAEAERINRPLLVVVSTRVGLVEFNGKRLFEDQQFASLINESFIPVMVDVNERPDLGSFYVESSVLFQRHFIWPLVFAATPDGVPVEQMPREGNGMASIGQAASWARVFSNRWRLESESLKEQGARFLATLDRLLGNVSELGEVDYKPTHADVISSAYSGLSAVADDEFGTFTMGRNYIRPTVLSAVIRLSAGFEENDYRKGRTEALARISLDTMQMSGIHDHVFGGWYRDSDRPSWNSPRGGKYLIDQAEMIIAYLDGYRAFGESSYLETARETGDFILDFLQSMDGQFRHGMFSRSDFGLKSPIYWRPEDVESLLDEEQYQVVKTLSKLSRYGNVPSVNNDSGSRANVLAIIEDPEVAASALGLEKNKMLRIWKGALDELRENGQRLNLWGAEDFVMLGESSRAISGLTYLWKVTGDEKYLDGALKGMSFLQENFLKGEPSEWPRLWSRGASKTKAFHEDLLALSVASLRVFEVTGDAAMLELSILAADHVLSEHHSEADDRSKVLIRYKMWDIEWRTSDDQTTPNVHGLGLEACGGLAVITGQEKWLSHYDDLSSVAKRISNKWLFFASGSSLSEILENPRDTKVFVVRGGTSGTWKPEYLKAWKEEFPGELMLLRVSEKESVGDDLESNLSPAILKALKESKLSIIQPLK